MNENGDGPSGLYALKEMRIIDLSNGSIPWSDNGSAANRFLWSPNGRFVAAECSGRQWTETDVIDISDFTKTDLPKADDLQKLCPGVSAPNAGAPIILCAIDKWISDDVISVSFRWNTNRDTEVTGEYEYDMSRKSVEIEKADEVSAG